MPLLAYFAIVGTALTAMLFVAEAKLEAPGELAYSTPSVSVPQGAALTAPVRAREAFWASAPESAFADNAKFAAVDTVPVTEAVVAPKPAAVAAVAEPRRLSQASGESRRQAVARVREREREVVEMRRDRNRAVEIQRNAGMTRERHARSGFFGLSIW